MKTPEQIYAMIKKLEERYQKEKRSYLEEVVKETNVPIRTHYGILNSYSDGIMYLKWVVGDNLTQLKDAEQVTESNLCSIKKTEGKQND